MQYRIYKSIYCSLELYCIFIFFPRRHKCSEKYNSCEKGWENRWKESAGTKSALWIKVKIKLDCWFKCTAIPGTRPFGNSGWEGQSLNMLVNLVTFEISQLLIPTVLVSLRSSRTSVQFLFERSCRFEFRASGCSNGHCLIGSRIPSLASCSFHGLKCSKTDQLNFISCCHVVHHNFRKCFLQLHLYLFWSLLFFCNCCN